MVSFWNTLCNVRVEMYIMSCTHLAAYATNVDTGSKVIDDEGNKTQIDIGLPCDTCSFFMLSWQRAKFWVVLPLFDKCSFFQRFFGFWRGLVFRQLLLVGGYLVLSKGLIGRISFFLAVGTGDFLVLFDGFFGRKLFRWPWLKKLTESSTRSAILNSSLSTSTLSLTSHKISAVLLIVLPLLSTL